MALVPVRNSVPDLVDMALIPNDADDEHCHVSGIAGSREDKSWEDGEGRIGGSSDVDGITSRPHGRPLDTQNNSSELITGGTRNFH